VVRGLCFLAARAAGRLARDLGRDLSAPLAALAMLTGFWLAPAAANAAQDLTGAIADKRTWRFDHWEFARMNGPQKNWFRPDAFAALPDDVVIATSEVGLISALAPRKKIIDIAGLNDPAIALSGFSAARLFADGGPDVLFFPHPDYREFIQQMLEAPEITGYDLYPPGALGSLLGVGIKRSSRHYRKMRDLMGNRSPVARDKYDPTLQLKLR
jgi:hypothetical protein